MRRNLLSVKLFNKQPNLKILKEALMLVLVSLSAEVGLVVRRQYQIHVNLCNAGC